MCYLYVLGSMVKAVCDLYVLGSMVKAVISMYWDQWLRL